MSKTVCASEYGGPNDPSSGTNGYKGDYLPGKMAFAELNMGTALGKLPYKSKVEITYNGRSVIAEKLDIGLGGPGCGGVSRGIDLWYETARALGFNGLAPVTVTLEHEQPSEGQKKSVLFGLPFPPTPSLPGEFGQVPNPGKVIEKAKEGLTTLDSIGKIADLLATKDGWIRIGKVVIGLFLLLAGVLDMARFQPEPVNTFNRQATTARRTYKNAKDARELATVLAK